MISFDIKNRFTGNVLFTAEIECDETAGNSIKIGLAVKWGFKNSAYLRDAYLRDADLRGADLEGADLEGADLEGADLRDAYLRDADLRDAYLRGAYLEGAKGIVSFSGVGKHGRFDFVHNHGSKIMCQLGCFYGTHTEAIKRIDEYYGKGSGYASMIRAAVKCLKEQS